MTQPYLVAFQHAEWQARQVLRKHAKKRPLGKIEREYRYMPRQPVLSCRSVHPVDLSGTRTYRSRSSMDIIEEQHKLIHDIYSQVTSARNANSAPAGRRSSASSEAGQPLKNLQVQGVTQAATPRPKTSPAHIPPGDKPQRVLTARLRRRPKTTGCRMKAKPATDCHMSPDIRERFTESASELQEINDVVKAQWDPGNHSLDEGQFVRGKKNNDNPTVDAKEEVQWLSFGGGARNCNEGIVEAFTVMKSSDEYYSIDSITGMQVARQVQKGDRVRIGRNGDLKVAGVELAQYLETAERDQNENDSDDYDVSDIVLPDGVVPLCWQDQLNIPNVKIVESGSPRLETSRYNYCETHPVKFERLLQDEPPVQLKPRSNIQMASKGGYKVMSRTKARTGLYGQGATSSTITNVTIGGMSDAEYSSVTYEDVLKQKVGDRPKAKGKHSAKEFGFVTTVSKTGSKQESDSKQKDKNSRDIRSGKSRQNENQSKSRQSQRDGEREAGSRASSHGSRPTTAHSGLFVLMPRSQVEPLVVGNGTKSTDSSRAKSPLRSTSASKQRASNMTPTRTSTPPTYKVQPGRVPDTEYIQIASQIPINKDSLGRVATPPKQDSSYIQAVSNHNKHNSQQVVLEGDDGRSDDDSTKAMLPIDREGTPSAPQNTPPSSRALSPETDYAFDIPTAGDIDDISEPDSLAIQTNSHNQYATDIVTSDCVVPEPVANRDSTEQADEYQDPSSNPDTAVSEQTGVLDSALIDALNETSIDETGEQEGEHQTTQ